MLGRVQLPPLHVEVRPPRFDLQSLFTWCLRGFTLKCLFSLVLPIPTSFSQAVTPSQLSHFTASSKPSSDVGIPSPTLSKRGITPLPPQHRPIGSFLLSSILDSWRKLAESRKYRDNPYSFFMNPLFTISFSLSRLGCGGGCYDSSASVLSNHSHGLGRHLIDVNLAVGLGWVEMLKLETVLLCITAWLPLYDTPVSYLRNITFLHFIF